MIAELLAQRLYTRDVAWLCKEPGVSPRGITPFFSTPPAHSHRANVQRRPAFDKWNSTGSPHLNLEAGLGVSVRPWRRELLSALEEECRLRTG